MHLNEDGSYLISHVMSLQKNRTTPGWSLEYQTPSTDCREPCQSSMARNCPGGQQVFTSVLKASVDPERIDARTTNIALIVHMVSDVAGVEQSQSNILAQENNGHRCHQCHVPTYTGQHSFHCLQGKFGALYADCCQTVCMLFSLTPN